MLSYLNMSPYGPSLPWISYLLEWDVPIRPWPFFWYDTNFPIPLLVWRRLRTLGTFLHNAAHMCYLLEWDQYPHMAPLCHEFHKVWQRMSKRRPSGYHREEQPHHVIAQVLSIADLQSMKSLWKKYSMLDVRFIEHNCIFFPDRKEIFFYQNLIKIILYCYVNSSKRWNHMTSF